MINSSKAALALLLALPAAAAETTAKMEGTVAVVNGTPILMSEYQKEAATAVDFWSKTNPAAIADPANLRKLRESTLEELITRELLVQEGQRAKLKVREREIDNAVEEIKGRFKRDETGRALDEAEMEKAFQAQLKAEGLDYAKFRERLTRQIMARKVIDENVISKVAPPTEADVKAYFDKINAYIASKSSDNPKGMSEDEGSALREAASQVRAMSSERVRVQRIVIRLSPGATENERKRALKTAVDVKKRLDKGEDFAKVAQEESEDPESASRGGDIGYVLRGVAPPALEKAAFTMNVGDTSEPILTEAGYNVIRVTEKRAASAPQFEMFKEDLANFLGGMSRQKQLESYVQGLRQKATIQRNLPAAL